MRIGVLNNLRAGRNSTEVSQILNLLGRYPHVSCVETTNVHAVPEALASLARQDVELLVINGGDGTLQYALTKILGDGGFDRIPMVAPLRGGRTNMSALDLGAHRNPVKGLRDLLEDAKAGNIARRIVDRSLLRVETFRNRSVNYGFFFGAGMIHRAISLTHELFPTGKSQGVFGAGIVTASLIVRVGMNRLDGVLAPDKAQITLDGDLVPQGEFSLVIASSLRRLFCRMNPFWGQEKGPVRFTAMASGSVRVGAAVLGILRGKPKPFVTPQTGYTSKNVDTARLRISCGFTVDGEVIEPRADEVVSITGDHRITFVRA